MTNEPVITFHAHARVGMRTRRITEDQVRRALATYHTRVPAEPLPYLTVQAIVYVATIGGRDLKVYVEAGSDPLYVRRVAWKREPL